MSYVEGFVLAVPTRRKQEFIDHANRADAVFLEQGALRIVECWATRDAAMAKMDELMKDPRMDPAQNPMPFDGQRMIYGGFMPVVEVGDRR